MENTCSIIKTLMIDLQRSSESVDAYLRSLVDLLYAKLSPLSIAAYLSMPHEEKLVLVKEEGKNFDNQISGMYNFSQVVRKAVTGGEIVLLPDDELQKNLDKVLIMVPLSGLDQNIGLLCCIYPLEQMDEVRLRLDFYELVGRAAGTSCHMIRLMSAAQPAGRGDPDRAYTDKMMSLGILSSGVAHEFNNILSAIKGHAELIRLKDFSRDAVGNAIRIIDEQTERGAQLIESLSIFSRDKKDKLEHVALPAIVDDVIDMQKRSLDNEHIVVNKTFLDAPRVLANKNQIREALLNVLLHSRQAISAGGSGTIDIRLEFVDDAVLLTIHDSGVGITEDSYNAISFLPRDSDATADGPHSGAGLGLVIAFGIMESHGGRLFIKSSPDGGNRVAMIFKRYESRTPAGAERKDFVYFGNTRILIVDDEDAIRDFLHSTFEMMGFQVLSATNGEEAVDMVSFEVIDLVFLDYLMPGMRGDKIFETIKRESPDTDVVFITGMGDVPSIQRYIDEGLASVLKKPFRIETIMKTANDLIHKRMQRN